MSRNDSLRTKAEELVRKKGAIDKSFYEKDLSDLVEELSIYQIELEQQNNELIHSQEQLNRSKEKYTDLFNNAPIGYLILDLKKNVIELNNTACRILGMDLLMIKDKPITKLIHPEFQDDFYFFFNTIAKERISSRCDIKLYSIEKRHFFVRLIGQPESDDLNGEIKIRLAMIDINIEKELEEKLLEETEKARESDRLKSAFLANMSHEIRTPLNAVLGFASLLTEKDLDADTVKKFAEIISNSGNRLLDLINNILDLSKIESGNMQVKKLACAPSKIINELVELYRIKAKEKNLAVLTNIPDPFTSLRIYSDPLKIHQILANLISNAIKFADEGKIEIGFQIAGKKITFFVRDEGPGISEDLIPHLFERFYQTENSTTSANEGSGLGLSLCQALVNLMEGKIWVDSKSGQGATFYFELPFEPVGNEYKTTNRKNLTKPESKAKCKILLVEDDLANANYFSHVVQKSNNIEVAHSTNGRDAVELVRKSPELKLIVMDLKMPLLDGYDATREIRKFNKHIPIVALTAFAMEGDRDKAINAGCNDYLPKPVKKENIMGVINKYCGD